MKTIFFALASVALILFFYWQWHITPPAAPHLKRIALKAPTLELWRPGLPVPAPEPPPSPRRITQAPPPKPRPAPETPPVNPPKVVPTTVHPQKTAPPPPPPVVAPTPAVCRLIGWFPAGRSAEDYAHHWHFQHVQLKRQTRLLHLYRVYLLARHPQTQARILVRLKAAHLHTFYLMNKPTDPQGYSVGVYDALAGAFQRRAELFHLGFRPHLEIMTHREKQVWIAVTTRRVPEAGWLEWQKTRLRDRSCAP
jgi:hypothetical protein